MYQGAIPKDLRTFWILKTLHKRLTNCSQEPKSGCNSPYPTTTMFPIVGLFFFDKFKKKSYFFLQNSIYYLKKKI